MSLARPIGLLGAWILLSGAPLQLSAQTSGGCAKCGGAHHLHTPTHSAIRASSAVRSSQKAAPGGFDIQINFGGGLTASQQAAFTSAESLWEHHLTGYRGTISLGPLTITARGIAIDGTGGTLGSAGPTSGSSHEGFFLAATGAMDFDIADLAALEAGGTLYHIVAHELAHVIGFGTLWDGPGLGQAGTQQVYLNGSGQYTGTEGLGQWITEFGQSPLSTFVPVELGGSPGTANGHWDEVLNGSGPTGFTDSLGRDLADELLTGWVPSNPDQIWLSQTSIASFGDLGYTYNLTPYSVPEPHSTLLLLASLAAFSGRRR